MNEDRLVERLRRQFAQAVNGLERGIGDDAAVVRGPGSGRRWAITADMLLEEIDFRRDWQTATQLGWKSLVVNLSDLAAMGAVPLYYLVALALPADIPRRWVSGFYRGLAQAGRCNSTSLIGGDLSRSPRGIQVTITAIGRLDRCPPLYRSGGAAGDRIYVTGVLGRAAAGLQLLLEGRTAGRSPGERKALRAHRTPESRCEAGAWLARHRYPSAMMDLSDGLSLDLKRMCRASRAGAEIWESHLPLFEASTAWGCDPVRMALHGGEDFELLIAVPEDRAVDLERGYPARFPALRWIGRLNASRRITLRQAPGRPAKRLPALGFDHFRPPAATFSTEMHQ